MFLLAVFRVYGKTDEQSAAAYDFPRPNFILRLADRGKIQARARETAVQHTYGSLHSSYHLVDTSLRSGKRRAERRNERGKEEGRERKRDKEVNRVVVVIVAAPVGKTKAEDERGGGGGWVEKEGWQKSRGRGRRWLEASGVEAAAEGGNDPAHRGQPLHYASRVS